MFVASESGPHGDALFMPGPVFPRTVDVRSTSEGFEQDRGGLDLCFRKTVLEESQRGPDLEF